MTHQAFRWLCAITPAFAAAALLSNCAVGPDFRNPAPPVVTRYTREPLPARTSGSDVAFGQQQRLLPGGEVPEQWWRLFRSPSLDALVEQALANNPTLQSALASLRATRQATYAQEGKFFPLVQANFNPTEQRTSVALAPIPANGTNIFTLDTAQVLVSYTFDVWGLNRRTVESLEALSDVQRFQVEAAYLSLTSNIVVAAITEASLQGQIDATDQLITTTSRMVGTLRNQLNAGYSNRSDLAVQEASLAQAKATLPPLRRALAQQQDLLAALAGTFPSEAPRQIFKLSEFHLPTNLPISLPSQLIEQRPDIRAAEEQMHSASAEIGVATANLLPQFTISADAGFMNTALAHLLAPQNFFWDLAGNATQTIFDGGTLLHQLQQAKDNYQAAAWTYQGTVISAVQNVADTLRALQNDADALRAAQDFQRAAKVSFDLANQQVQSGNANVLLLLTSQQGSLQSNIQVVQAQANRLADTAALFTALGGGWWSRPELPVDKNLNVSTGQTKPVPRADQSGNLIDLLSSRK